MTPNAPTPGIGDAGRRAEEFSSGQDNTESKQFRRELQGFRRPIAELIFGSLDAPAREQQRATRGGRR